MESGTAFPTKPTFKLLNLAFRLDSDSTSSSSSSNSDDISDASSSNPTSLASSTDIEPPKRKNPKLVGKYSIINQAIIKDAFLQKKESDESNADEQFASWSTSELIRHFDPCK